MIDTLLFEQTPEQQETFSKVDLHSRRIFSFDFSSQDYCSSLDTIIIFGMSFDLIYIYKIYRN